MNRTPLSNRRPGTRVCCTGILPLAGLALALAIFPATTAFAGSMTLDWGGLGSPDGISGVIKLAGVLTVISLAPALLMLVTSFTRIIVVFAFLRQALGVPQAPPSQIMTGLALFLTLFVMMPVIKDVNQNALAPYMAEKINKEEALDRGLKPVRDFMFSHTRESDLALFVSASGAEKPDKPENVATWTLIPAFVLSELKTAFLIGFVLYIPFVIIDLVVSSVLLSMGMVMLPPVVVALPMKLLLFVLVDGWSLLVGTLLKTFAV